MSVFTIGLVAGAQACSATQIVEVEKPQRVYLTDVKTETVEVPMPADVPAACYELRDKASELLDNTSQLSGTHGRISQLLSDIATQMMSDDPNAVVEIKREYMDIQRDDTELWQSLGTNQYELRTKIEGCTG